MSSLLYLRKFSKNIIDFLRIFGNLRQLELTNIIAYISWIFMLWLIFLIWVWLRILISRGMKYFVVAVSYKLINWVFLLLTFQRCLNFLFFILFLFFRFTLTLLWFFYFCAFRFLVFNNLRILLFVFLLIWLDLTIFFLFWLLNFLCRLLNFLCWLLNFLWWIITFLCLLITLLWSLIILLCWLLNLLFRLLTFIHLLIWAYILITLILVIGFLIFIAFLFFLWLRINIWIHNPTSQTKRIWLYRRYFCIIIILHLNFKLIGNWVFNNVTFRGRSLIVINIIHWVSWRQLFILLFYFFRNHLLFFSILFLYIFNLHLRYNKLFLFL